MRVVLVCGTYAPARDGVADYTGSLAAALHGRGVDATIVSAEASAVAGNSGTAAAADNARTAAEPIVRCVTRRWDLRGAPEAARRIAALAPDVVHVQFAPSAYGFSPAVGLLPPLLRAAGSRAPVVTTLHEYGWWSWPARVPARAWSALERTGWWDRETAALAPRSSALVVTNPGAAGVVQRRLRRAPAVVPIGTNVAPAGWDRDGARREVRAELGLARDATLLAFFGFVHPVKGVRYLLEALSVLRRERPDVHLAVVGGFASLALPGAEAVSFRRELDKHATDCGVGDTVTFLGHRPAAEVSRVLTAADVGVLPFTAGVTTKSSALLALWAHALPVVVTAPATPAEADPEVADGRTAVVVPARRDAAALTDGLRRALGDDALRRRVAAGGAAAVGRRSWERIAAPHAEVYAAVLP